MAMFRSRLGVALAINGLVLAFLAAMLLGGDDDVRVSASRAYLVVLLIAPVAAGVLLALPAAHRDMALRGALVAMVAALLATNFDTFGDVTSHQTAHTASAQLPPR